MVSDDGTGPTRRLERVPRPKEDAILLALGDPQSRVLLRFLNDAPRSVQDLLQVSALPQASIYRKLRELQESSLVGVQRSILATDGHRTDLFRSLLVEAQVRFRGPEVEVLAAFRDLAAERLGDLWVRVRSEVKRT